MSPNYSYDHLGSVWYHSEPSEGPYPIAQSVSGQESFFAVSYSKPALVFRVLGIYNFAKT